MRAWKEGADDAATEIFLRYQHRLLGLVRSRLSKKLARRVDAEDILLSAYRSFFVGVRKGRCVTPDGDDLWPLLTTIALRKLAGKARHHQAECRSIDQEHLQDSSLIESVIREEPTAEQAALLSDEIQLLMSQLDETAREVLVRTLQGWDVPAIANELALNETTVRRALERIRERLSRSTNHLRLIPGPPVMESPIRQSDRARPQKMNLQGIVEYKDYLLKRLIGSGAFSKVYLATHRSSRMPVAIKYVRKDCLSDPRATSSLIHEYEILRQLNHPAILAVRGWGTTPGGSLFLVTDFVDGTDLAQWRETSHPTPYQILKVANEVAAAIAAAHSEQVIHGDLKPANVLRDNSGRTILCDFGLSRYVTHPDDVPHGGTAGFLAPEQISDSFGPVTRLTDVYGFGGLLYALLTGRPPMTGRDLPEIMANVLSQHLPHAPLPSNDEISSRTNSLILRCLQKEPRLRFQSMQDVMVALTSLIGEQIKAVETH